jgi:glutaminyl-peptide cyclotransferase
MSSALQSTSAVVPSAREVVPSAVAVVPGAAEVVPSDVAAVPSAVVALPATSSVLQPTSNVLPSAVAAVPATSSALQSTSAVVPSAVAVVPSAVAVVPPASNVAPTIGYTIVASFPHDPAAFTQGLVYVGGDRFFEGTGDEGPNPALRSTLRETELATGAALRSVALPDGQFGEGVAVLGERIFQLTWRDCVGHIYDLSFAPVGTFQMPIDPRDGLCLEGWGLATDGTRLILSDGSERLFFVDPAATERSGQLAITGEIQVNDAGNPVGRLNELEFIKGEVYANIWFEDRIARIDPASGRVNSFIDLSGLRDQIPPAEHGPVPPEVLNGIAYDAAGDRLFVTGKLWPRLFEIDLTAEQAYRLFLPITDKA